MRGFRSLVLPFFGLALLLPEAVASAGEPVQGERVHLATYEVASDIFGDGLHIGNSESVLSGDMLARHGVGQFQDMAGVAPNLFSSNSDSRGFGDVLSMRGVANSIFFSSPSVALYVDDVPGGSVSSYPSLLLNVVNIAVKVGPQVSDFGRNAPGGLIAITTRQPRDVHGGRIAVEYGSFDSMALQASADGPLGDDFGYSAAIQVSERDGYIDNTFQNRSEDDRKSVAGRGALFWRPDDETELRFGVFVEDVDDGAPRLSSLGSPDPFVVSSDVDARTKINRLQLSFRAKRDFDWGSVTATTSRQDWELDPSVTDLDLMSLPLAWSEVIQHEEIWTQEVRFASTPGVEGMNWRAGVFFFDSQLTGDAVREFIVPPNQFVPPGFVQTERTVFDIDQTSYAAYGNLEFPVSDALDLEFGLRAERVQSDISRSKTSANNYGFPAPPEPPLDASQTHDQVSATFGIDSALSENLSWSAKTSIARKPDGYSGFSGNPQFAAFDRERIWSSEIGITFGAQDGVFRGSLLGFVNKIDDYQLERTVPNSTDFVVVNADSVTARGLEARFVWTPVDRVSFDLQAGYTDAKFDEHRDANGADVSGKSVPFIPRFTLRTGVTVDFGGGFFADADLSAFGRTHYDEQNVGAFSQPSYAVFGAQAGYRSNGLTVSVFARNLFDEEFYQFINPEIFAGSPGAPRRFGVLVSWMY